METLEENNESDPKYCGNTYSNEPLGILEHAVLLEIEYLMKQAENILWVKLLYVIYFTANIIKK